MDVRQRLAASIEITEKVTQRLRWIREELELQHSREPNFLQCQEELFLAKVQIDIVSACMISLRKKLD